MTDEDTLKQFDAHFTSVISFLHPSMQKELQKRWMRRTRRKTIKDFIKKIV